MRQHSSNTKSSKNLTRLNSGFSRAPVSKAHVKIVSSNGSPTRDISETKLKEDTVVLLNTTELKEQVVNTITEHSDDKSKKVTPTLRMLETELKEKEIFHITSKP